MLEDVPFHIFAATSKDQYWKPMPGMWSELEKLFEEDGVKIGNIRSLSARDMC